jgi:hypothetical protein
MMTAETTDQERKSWVATRKEAALEIDPKTADVDWCWGQILDPYGVHPDLPPECDQVGRLYFARAPGSDVWVSFYDLPEAVCARLWDRVYAGDISDDPLGWLAGEPVPPRDWR